MTPAFRYIEDHRERFLQELFRLLRQRSISAQNDGMEACADLLASMMRDVGIDARVCPTDGHPAVYGEYGPAGGRTVLIYGHYDVQPPEPLELWESDPFEPTIRGDRIYGRGTSDNKGQLFAYLKGLESYLKSVGEPKVRLKFLFEGEEEISSPSLGPFVEKNKDLLACDLCLFPDGHLHRSGTPTVVLGLKGMLYLQLTAKEAKVDLHSMFAPSVKSPVWRLVTLLSTLKGEDGFVRIEGFYDDVKPPLPEEIEAVKRIPFDPEELRREMGIDDLLDNRNGKDFYGNLTFEPTCNIAGLTAGYQGPGAKTVMPCRASAKIDMRLVSGQTPDGVFDLFMKHLKKHGFESVEVEKIGAIIPSRTPITDPCVRPVVEAVETGWSETPYVYPSSGGSGPCYLFEQHLGVPCISLPSAPATHNNHAPNENITLSGFFNAARTAAAIIDKMSGNREGE